MTQATAILELQDVVFRWPGKRGFGVDVPAFAVAEAERVLVLGASGSGKSTLLSLICGTLTPSRGVIRINGTDISWLSAGRRDRFRAEQIGLIFQQFNLLPYASVIDNILLPLRFAPQRRAGVAHPQEAARKLCLDLGLPEDAVEAQAGTLSVGQQQRVAAARALIGAPKLIIADEPTSALDAATQATFLELLFAQARTYGSTVLMVSHDERLNAQFDRVVQLEDILSTQRAVA